MTVIETIRLVGSEFVAVPDAEIEQWIELVSPMVGKKQFGKLYVQALACLVCHKMKMAGKGKNPLGELGTIGIGFAVGSVSEGGSSISFGANQSSNLSKDAELGLTQYGVQYLSLRRMAIVPIRCAGESDLFGTAESKYSDDKVATDEEVDNMFNDVFGSSGGTGDKPDDGGSGSIDDEMVASDNEVNEMFNEVFGGKVPPTDTE